MAGLLGINAVAFLAVENFESYKAVLAHLYSFPFIFLLSLAKIGRSNFLPLASSSSVPCVL